MKKKDPEIEAFLEHFEQEVFPNIKSSAMTVGILSGKPDAKMCLEIGASVLLEKPLIMLVSRGVYIPRELRRLATEIIEVAWPMSKLDEEAVQAALTRVTTMLAQRQQR